MSSIDVQSLLREIAPGHPCGEDLSADPLYASLDRMVQGKPEAEYGDTVIAAQGPDWKELHKACLGLLARSRDLRPMVYLAVSAMNLDGVRGICESLALLEGAIEKYWDDLYPRLDPEDDLDPLERLNILSGLTATASFNDPVRFEGRLREVPLCNSRELGAFSLRDIGASKGDVKSLGPGKTPPTPAMITAAFDATSLEALQATAAAIIETSNHVMAIDRLLGEKVGDGRKPEFTRLRQTLGEMRSAVETHITRRGGGVASPAPGDAASGNIAAPAHGTNGSSASSGEVESTDDVVKLLKNIYRYYDRAEPSSPVPLVLRVAERLVSKNFREIMAILTPDLFTQLETIASDGEKGGKKD